MTVFTRLATGAALALALGAPAVASTEAGESDVRETLHASVESMRDYADDQRDEAVEKAEGLIESLDAEIERMAEEARSEWVEMSASAQDESAETLASLRAERDDLVEWLGAMRHAAGDAWADARTGFVKAWDDVEATWSEATEEDAEAD